MKPAPRTLLRRSLITLALAAAGLAAQAQNQASQFYEDALQRFEKRDYAGSIVQLKNVLRSDSKNLSAQVLLGRALLEDGQVGPAEVAFTEALRLGVNRAEVVVPMARAVINQGKPDEVLSSPRFALEGLPKPTQYQLLLLRAAAATDLADIKAAIKAAEDARALDANDAGSYVGEVPARIRARQLKEALAAADKAVALAPNNADAHHARGEALHVVPNLNAALASYDKTLSIEPKHIGALIARAGIHMDFNRVDAAAADVAAVLKESPREPRALYLKALIAEKQGRTSEARATLNELTALLDPIPAQYLRYRPQTQMLGGMAHYGLGQREKAKPYLEGVLRSQPGHTVSKVLASIYLAERNVDPAISVLDAYLRANPSDLQAVTLLASAHMSQGRHARASQLLQDALKFGEQPQIRTSLGLSLAGGGRFGEAIKELEAVLVKDPKQLQAGFALGSLYLQAGQSANALRVAESLNKNYPNNASVLQLMGGARQLRGDTAGARTAFEAAAAADATLLAPLVGLARLDMQAGAFPKAAERLNAAFAKSDRDQDALAAIAELSERTGKLDDAQRWREKADEVAGADNPMPAIALVEFLLRHNRLPQAREAIKRAQSKAPDAVATLVAAARVNLASADAASARNNLSRAASTAGYNAPLLTQIAVLQRQAGAAQAAAHSLDKALGERADYMPAVALRTELDIQAGEFAKAEQRIQQIQRAQPRSGLGHSLAGDLALARKQLDTATAAFRRAHELDKNSASFMRLFTVTMRRDKTAGMRMAEQWLAANPRDAVALRALADSQFNAGNLAAARRHYEALAKLLPSDPETYNNLAHVLLQQKDPGALKVAEQALALAPGAPHVVGTAGWVAFKSGQNDRALQLLRDARLRDPANADTRFFLGSVLAAMGRGGEARQEIVAALQPASGLNYRSEAEQLLATLK